MNEMISCWVPKDSILRWKKERVELDPQQFCFSPSLSSLGVSIDSSGLVVTNVNLNHMKYNAGLIEPAIDHGIVKVSFVLEEDRVNDEMTCIGVCAYPLDSFNYEESAQIWVFRCFSGELYVKGKKQGRVLERCHAGGVVDMIINMNDYTVSMHVNHHDYGVVFENIPSLIHPIVVFYNTTPPQRSVRLQSVECISQPSLSLSVSQSVDVDSSAIQDRIPSCIHYLTE